MKQWEKKENNREETANHVFMARRLSADGLCTRQEFSPFSQPRGESSEPVVRPFVLIFILLLIIELLAPRVTQTADHAPTTAYSSAHQHLTLFEMRNK